VIQALLASNILFVYFNRRFAQDIFQVTQITLIQNLNSSIF